MSTRTKIWLGLLFGLVLAQTAASILMVRGPALTISSDLIQGALLLVAAAAYLPNLRAQRCPTFHVRLFWLLMTTGMVLWVTYQCMWNYFEVIKRVDVPVIFLGDVVLFMHLVPMIAALAVLPHMREDERDERIRMLDFSLLLTWWVFVYVYAVIPWQTVQIDEPTYSSNFNNAYLTEKAVLLAALAFLAYTARGGWRQLYAQFLGASVLYASSSYVANWAIGHKRYYSGSIYDIPLTISIAWMAVPSLLALQLDLSEVKPAQPRLGVWITRLSMIALLSLPWAALHSDFAPAIEPPVKSFRITISLLIMVMMGVVVFWRQGLLRNELSLFLDKSRISIEDLKQLQEKLIQSEKLASLGQLVGGAAHEINNPLTAMLGYSDLLNASTLPPDEKFLASQIGQQVRQTNALVSSLLTFARQAPARLASVDLNPVLQTAARLLAPKTEAQAIALRLDLAPSLPPVLADCNQILQVCLHLAGQISGRLTGEGARTLFIRSHADGDRVLVDFSGYEFLGYGGLLSSHGLSAALVSGGTPASLSLSACLRIVEEHGGRLLQSTPPERHALRVELRVAGHSGVRSAYAGFEKLSARG